MIWLASLPGRIAVIAAAMVAAWGWLKVHDYKIAKKTEAEIVQRSEDQGERNAAAADKAHDAARSPGALERLRNSAITCPDCSKRPVPIVASPNNKTGR